MSGNHTNPGYAQTGRKITYALPLVVKRMNIYINLYLYLHEYFPLIIGLMPVMIPDNPYSLQLKACSRIRVYECRSFGRSSKNALAPSSPAKDSGRLQDAISTRIPHNISLSIAGIRRLATARI